MNRMKTYFALLLALALCAVILTGCTGTKASEPTPTPSATPAPTATAKPSATPAPTATAKPSATPAPTATAKPSATPAPSATAKPSTTPAPTATEKPGETSTSAGDAAPVVTARPSPTPLPKPDKALMIDDWAAEYVEGDVEEVLENLLNNPEPEIVIELPEVKA